MAEREASFWLHLRNIDYRLYAHVDPSEPHVPQRYRLTLTLTIILALTLPLNLMCPKGIDIYRTVSVLGYCLLPMVIFSGCAVLLSMKGLIGLFLGALSIAWCTYSASCMFVQILNDSDQQWLIRYPVFLLYSTFALITVF